MCLGTLLKFYEEVNSIALLKSPSDSLTGTCAGLPPSDRESQDSECPGTCARRGSPSAWGGAALPDPIVCGERGGPCKLLSLCLSPCDSSLLEMAAGTRWGHSCCFQGAIRSLCPPGVSLGRFGATSGIPQLLGRKAWGPQAGNVSLPRAAADLRDVCALLPHPSGPLAAHWKHSSPVSPVRDPCSAALGALFPGPRRLLLPSPQVAVLPMAVRAALVFVAARPGLPAEVLGQGVSVCDWTAMAGRQAIQKVLLQTCSSQLCLEYGTYAGSTVSRVQGSELQRVSPSASPSQTEVGAAPHPAPSCFQPPQDSEHRESR